MPAAPHGAVHLATLDLRLTPVHTATGPRLHVTAPATDEQI